MHQLMTSLHRHLNPRHQKARSKGTAVLFMDPPRVMRKEPWQDTEPRWRMSELKDPWGDRVV